MKKSLILASFFALLISANAFAKSSDNGLSATGIQACTTKCQGMGLKVARNSSEVKGGCICETDDGNTVNADSIDNE